MACAGKFAVEGMMESLAPVSQRFGVHVTLVEPGAVNTEFVANVGVAFGLPTGTTDSYTSMLTSYFSGTEAVYAGAQTDDDVAEVLVAVASDAAPHLRYQTSDSVRQLTSLKYVDPTGDSVVRLTGRRLPQGS